MTPLSTPHEATDECEGIHCYFHQVDEPGPGYLACGECFHLFRTKRDLRRRWREMWAEICAGPEQPWFSNEWSTGKLRFWWVMLTVRVNKIGFCPFCAHDF